MASNHEKKLKLIEEMEKLRNPTAFTAKDAAIQAARDNDIKMLDEAHKLFKRAEAVAYVVDEAIKLVNAWWPREGQP